MSPATRRCPFAPAKGRQRLHPVMLPDGPSRPIARSRGRTAGSSSSVPIQRWRRPSVSRREEPGALAVVGSAQTSSVKANSRSSSSKKIRGRFPIGPGSAEQRARELHFHRSREMASVGSGPAGGRIGVMSSPPDAFSAVSRRGVPIDRRPLRMFGFSRQKRVQDLGRAS